ncbi:uncharacterized protein NP_3018A [Natronomonas pharaonis DSM 2160]|uniref:Uncharacterized protein n=1 Tax=Natronomonas pharaonis (strain ATCC 35678 / DSM 2160 / CIP 103997 / JCM 8858 / NBRC 14720 / NCIMB 2260 / Gabara) TaxID=348780 RepID=A0A1U7EWW6_NATPD|nr:uncharacterized protein NP_3018A [Natronomonas pharaonis DSM 2160]
MCRGTAAYMPCRAVSRVISPPRTVTVTDLSGEYGQALINTLDTADGAVAYGLVFAFAVLFGSPRRSVAVWMTAGLLLWAVAFGALTAGGLSMLGTNAAEALAVAG